MAAAIESAFPGTDIELIDGGRGDFIVTAGDERVWDKKGQQRRFPEPPEIIDLLAELSAG